MFFSLIISYFLNNFIIISRPFLLKIGYQYIEHINNNAYPSKHAVIIFTFSISLYIWYNKALGISYFIIGILICSSRILLGIHWPLDIISSLLISFFSCIISKILYKLYNTCY